MATFEHRSALDSHTALGTLGQPISLEVEALVVPVVPVRAAACLSGDGAVASALAGAGAIPSEADTAQRKAAFGKLERILLGKTEDGETGDSTRPRPQQLVLVPVGSYGLDVWTPASDVDCLAIGVYGTSTFFALAAQRLRAAGAEDEGVCVVRRVRAQAGVTLELAVDGVRVNLQYASAGTVAETWPAALVVPPTLPMLAVSPQVLDKVRPARELHQLRQSFPASGGTGLCTAEVFGQAHRAIRTWAEARGLYAARLGYLGGFQIALLLARVMKLMQRALAEDGTGDGTCNVANVLTTFFAHYAGFDWATHAAFDPSFHCDRAPYRRLPHAQEPLVILGCIRPQLNTASMASVPSVRVLQHEFRRAAEVLASSSRSWDSFLSGGLSGDNIGAVVGMLPFAPAEFVRAYRSYVKVDVQYWGLSPTRGAAFVGWLESRCVLLMVDLARRLPQLGTRLWPGRFVDADSQNGQDGQNGQYQASYLIGLDLPADMGRNERRVAFGALQTALAYFERQVRCSDGPGAASSGTAHFDPQWQWIGVGVVDRAELDVTQLRLDGQLDGQLDGRAWRQHVGEEEDEEDDAEPYPKKERNKPLAVVHRPQAHRFRTARDVMARLRWDPELVGGEYVVGYEDRFAGAREKALAEWKSEQTDDEFIPQHRILYFQTTDGVVVWDRRTRTDVLFGSGQ